MEGQITAEEEEERLARSAADRAARCTASENACVRASENTSLRLDIATAWAGLEDACVRCAASAERREEERKKFMCFFALKHMCVV